MGPCHPSFHSQVCSSFLFSLFIPAIFRPAGVFAKVNRIVFTQQGNKFGVCDGDGNTALWQVGIFAIKAGLLMKSQIWDLVPNGTKVQIWSQKVPILHASPKFRVFKVFLGILGYLRVFFRVF